MQGYLWSAQLLVSFSEFFNIVRWNPSFPVEMKEEIKEEEKERERKDAFASSLENMQYFCHPKNNS